MCAMSYRIPLALLVLAVAVAGYWWYSLVLGSLFGDGNDVLRIHFLDVGQGDSVLIETPNNSRVLVDAGRGIRVLSALDDVLPMHDREIDVAVMTHPDADHIGGFVPVFDRYDVGSVVRSFISSGTNVYKSVMEATANEGSVVHLVSLPLSFTLDDVRFDTLWPIGENVRETNAASVVLLITYGSVQTLLTGDAPSAVEEFLVKSFGDMLYDIEILKAGHHGSKTSTSSVFLTHTQPNAVIYSSGKNNSYGHPHDEVLERIRLYSSEQGEQVPDEYRTSDGTVSFCVKAASFALCE